MPPRIGEELNDRERLFVAEYLVDMNASQAAIRAGYSPKTVGSNCYRVMRRPRVKAAIAEAMAARERDLQIDAREVLREIVRLSFGNMLDYVRVTEDGAAALDLSGLTRDKAAAIAEITLVEGAELTGRKARGGRRVKLKLADKPRSLFMLGRHLGLFPRGRDAAGVRAGEPAGGMAETREMSDLEFAQRILSMLADAPEGAEETQGEAGAQGGETGHPER